MERNRGRRGGGRGGGVGVGGGAGGGIDAGGFTMARSNSFASSVGLFSAHQDANGHSPQDEILGGDDCHSDGGVGDDRDGLGGRGAGAGGGRGGIEESDNKDRHGQIMENDSIDESAIQGITVYQNVDEIV